MTCRRHQRGLTFIELLAVVAILGVVASSLVLRVSRTTDASRCAAQRTLAIDLDRHARLLARSGVPGGVVMRAENSALVVRGVDSGEVLALLAPARGAAYGLGDEVVRYNGLGRSLDYAAWAQSGDARLRWSVEGQTGAPGEADR